MRRSFLNAVWLLALGCADAPPPAPPSTRCELPLSANPIDLAIRPELERRCATLVFEDEGPLCRRLMTDLLGRLPRSDEIAARCAGRAHEDVVRELQADPEAMRRSERWWLAERLAPRFASWRNAARLREWVRALHRGELRYAEFLALYLGEPVSPLVPREVFTVFLGRAPEPWEAIELARAFSPFTFLTQQDPDFEHLEDDQLAVDPLACRAHAGCRAEIFGGLELALSLPGDAPVPFDTLDEANRRELRRTAELIARQPAFYEAAADAILNRYLEWHDSGPTLRTPGQLHPAARQALAAHLEAHGDHAAAERLVLSSWWYRLKSRGLGSEDVDRPIDLVGPLKAIRRTVLLDTVLHAQLSEVGTCDPLDGHHDTFEWLTFLAEYAGQPRAELAENFTRLHERLEHRTPMFIDERGVPRLDPTYGALLDETFGCPYERPLHAGTALALEEQRRAERLCAGEFSSGADATQLLGRELDAEEREILEGATPQEICATLLLSAELTFY